MKRLILLAMIFLIGTLAYSQATITAGMTGLQLRNALNANFDSLYNKKMIDDFATPNLFITGATGKIDFYSGDLTLTRSSNTLTLAGGAYMNVISFCPITPKNNEGWYRIDPFTSYDGDGTFKDLYKGQVLMLRIVK